jgi:lysylphosphatidylglycerol synthetase-like protein (DUF2156 family)
MNFKIVRKYAPTMAGWLMFFSGILSVISVFRVVTSTFLTREFSDYVPIATTSRTVTLIIGLLLITTARGLWRRNKEAWQTGLTLTFISIIFHILKGFNFEEIVLSIFILFILFIFRYEFDMESRTKIGPESLRDFLYIIIVYVGYFVIGNYIIKGGLAHRVFHQSIFIVPVAILLIYFFQLFENYIAQPVSTTPLDIISILKKYGTDTLSYFATNSKKEIYYSPDRQAFLSYALKSGLAISTGDPVGPPNYLGPLISNFKHFWNNKKINTAFYGITDTYLPVFQHLKFKIIKIGEEAVVDIPKYDFDRLYAGSHGKRFRRAIRHISELGISFELKTLSELPASYYSQIVQVSEQWLNTYSIGRELGFSMNLARLPSVYDTDCRIALAVNSNSPVPQILAFLIFTPVYRANGYSLDIMRRLPDSPNGINEFLIVQTINTLKKEGRSILSLNFAALTDTSGKNPIILARISTLLSKRIKNIRNLNSLYSFNAKFNPRWVDRYLAYEKITDFPNLIIALFGLEGLLQIDLNFTKKLVGLLKLRPTSLTDHGQGRQ